jgi:topoisomerase-4 subunit A
MSTPKTPFSPSDITAGDALGQCMQSWFLEYASYVATDRALPHLADGLKPVQRRILHVMQQMEDGRYNKNASIIGESTKYHPHGDASIRDALVQLGQKKLCIDTQGNWGSLYTGHGAAAPRYIEARLTPFAKEVVFNSLTTEWKSTYDGRKKEPVALPSKYPILLDQGTEGIAVGLASRILPHNFNEIVDALICALKGKPFTLLPDFPTGGIADASAYNDGQRGGRVISRAHIKPAKCKDGALLVISSVPFGVTTDTLKESILSAHAKGKLQVAHIEDNTAAQVCVHVKFPKGQDLEAATNALYAYTKCQVSLPVYACVLDTRPRYLSVTELIQHSADQAERLCKREHEIELDHLRQQHLNLLLERIFIEKRVYRKLETCSEEESMHAAVRKAMRPSIKAFLDPLPDDCLKRLLQIPVRRISKFDAAKTDTQLQAFKDQMEAVELKLSDIRGFTVAYFRTIKKKYGKAYPRMTELATLAPVSLQTAALSNMHLYLDPDAGFVGTGLKGAPEIAMCSEVDDILTIRRDGILCVSRVAPKIYVGHKPLYCHLWDKESSDTHAMVYTDGTTGRTYFKHFSVGGVTRAREYPLIPAHPNSCIHWYRAIGAGKKSPNLTIKLKTGQKLRKRILALDTSSLKPLSRGARGTLITKYQVEHVTV